MPVFGSMLQSTLAQQSRSKSRLASCVLLLLGGTGTVFTTLQRSSNASSIIRTNRLSNLHRQATAFSVGSTLTDVAIAEEAVKAFVEGPFELTPTSGGVNNVVQYVTLPNNHRYVLRVYNNGYDSARVQYEHEILRQLNQQQLAFSVPKALPSLKDNKPHVLLSNGAEAAMFEVIPGVLPKSGFTREIGRACGELSGAIQKVELTQESPTAPYGNVFKAHKSMSRELFYKELQSPAFDSIRVASERAQELMREMEKTIEEYTAKDLPQCLIHGDLHYDNVLVHDGKVSGLLDFEFAAKDWRAMELAVSLSKYAGEKEALTYFNEFIAGFAEHGRLTADEIQAVPQLVNLRILSNVVYFIGRAISGEDNISSLTSRLEMYVNRMEWVRKNADAISKQLETEMMKFA